MTRCQRAKLERSFQRGEWRVGSAGANVFMKEEVNMGGRGRGDHGVMMSSTLATTAAAY